jgi:hypothetical protein
MARFCSNCGAPVSGQFCTACGAAIKAGPAQAQNETPPAAPVLQPVAAPPAVRKSSGTKILFIVLGVLMLFGAIGVGGIVYVGYRAKQKFAELKKDYGVGGDASSRTSSVGTRTFPPSKGSGCSLLEGQEAARILGVAVERAESEASASEGTLCKYWVSAPERQQLIREEIASGMAGMGKADTKSGEQDLEKLIGGAAGALIEANGDNKNSDYAFSLQVWRKNGKEQWEKMDSLQARTKDAAGADFASVAMQPVQGLGDRATVLAAGHSIMVLKGDTFFLLGFQQFVPGRDKTVALARVVAGRI